MEPHAASNGSKPADLKDLIAGLYGSQPLSSPVADEAGEGEMVPVVEDGDEFGDDGWEFKAAPSSDGGRANGDGIEVSYVFVHVHHGTAFNCHCRKLGRSGRPCSANHHNLKTTRRLPRCDVAITANMISVQLFSAPRDSSNGIAAI